MRDLYQMRDEVIIHMCDVQGGVINHMCDVYQMQDKAIIRMCKMSFRRQFCITQLWLKWLFGSRPFVGL